MRRIASRRLATFSRRLALLVGLSVTRPVAAAAVGAPPPSRGATESTSPTAARPLEPDSLPSLGIKVDVKLEITEVETQLGEFVTTAMSDQLRTAGFSLATPSDYEVVVVVRHFDRKDGLGYRATFELPMPRGQPSVVESVGCACAAVTFIAELSAAVAARMPDYAKAHRAALGAKAAPPAAVPAATPTADSSARPRYEMALLGGVGVGLMAVGVGAIAGGAVMWKRGEDNGEFSPRPSLRAGGIAFVASGVLMFAAGAGLFAGDIVIDRKWRRPLRVAGAFGPRGASVGLAGRF